MATPEQNKRYRYAEFERSWQGFEWLIKERLIKIDEITRNMIREMKTLGVPEWYIAEQLPIRFEELKNSVVAENEARFIHGKSFHGTQRRTVSE